MPPVVHALWIDNDNVLELLNLQNELTGAYLNNATVTVTLKDEASEAEIAGQTWPLTMNYVAASDGTYRATLHYQLVLLPNQRAIATVIVDGGLGQHAQWEIPVVASERTS